MKIDFKDQIGTSPLGIMFTTNEGKKIRGVTRADIKLNLDGHITCNMDIIVQDMEGNIKCVAGDVKYQAFNPASGEIEEIERVIFKEDIQHCCDTSGLDPEVYAIKCPICDKVHLV